MKDATRKRRWLRRLLRWAVVTATVLGVLAVAGKLWVVPAVVRSQIAKAFAERWDGVVQVDRVDVRFFGPLRLEGLTLRDASGRPWLSIGSVEIQLSPWPSLRPKVQRIDVRQVAVRAYLKDGQLQLPLRESSGQGPQGADFEKYVDLRQATVEEISAALVDEAGAASGFDALSARLVRQDQYVVSVGWGEQQQAGPIRLSGTIDPKDGVAKLTLRVDQAFDAAEMAKLFRLLGVQVVKDFSGRAAGTFQITGPVAEPRRLRIAGQAELKDFAASTEHGRLVEGVNGWARLSGTDDIRLDVFGLRGRCCKGLIAGQGAAVLRPDAENSPLRCGGIVEVAGVDAPELLRVAAGKPDAKSGVLHARLEAPVQPWDPQAYRSRGALLVRGIDVGRSEFLDELFRLLEANARKSEGGSDFASTFTMRGPVATILTGRLASAVSALDIEEGGTLDLQEQTVDCYVVGVAMKDVKDLLTGLPIPFLQLSANLADKLTRIHIEGKFSDPPSQLVRKEPITDFAAALRGSRLDFFRDIARGGRVGEDMLKALGGLLELLPLPKVRNPAPRE